MKPLTWLIVLAISAALAVGNSWIVFGIWAAIMFAIGAFLFCSSDWMPNGISNWIIDHEVFAWMTNAKLTAAYCVVGVAACLLGGAYGWPLAWIIGIRMLLFALAHLLGKALWMWQTRASRL